MGARVSVSARRPRAAAVCDRCGLWANHAALVPQMEWQGTRIGRRGRLLVHLSCRDVPNPTAKAIRLRPDGLPIRDPRPEPATVPGALLAGEAGAVLTDEAGAPLLVPQPTTILDDALATDEGYLVTADDGSVLILE